MSIEENQIKWVAIHKGFLALSARPKVKSFADLSGQGCTHVLTLLSEQEGARLIEQVVKQAGINWLWLPLEKATPPEKDQTEKIEQLFVQLQDLLQQKSRILIHCAAGIHRTGMITYALLRFLGYSAKEGLALLRELREVTAENVAEHRLDWGDQFFNETPMKHQ